MGKGKVIGAIAFAPSPDGTTRSTQKIGLFIMSDESTARLLAVLAGAGEQPELLPTMNISAIGEHGPETVGNGPLIDPGTDFSNATITQIPGRVGGHREACNYDMYTLVGEDMEPLARGIKSYAFAYALALRWSRDLGQPVKMMRRIESALPGAEISRLTETVDARDTSEGTCTASQIDAEILRLQNAKIAMHEIADDVRCMIEDADDAIIGLRALASIGGVPAEMIAQTARATADHFDTLHWYTLINHNDTEMIGELLATDAA